MSSKTSLLLLALAQVAFGDVVNDIVDDIDSDDRSALDSIMHDVSSGYITDATNADDLKTLVDDLASQLDLGSDTVDDLNDAINSVLDSDNVDNSLSSDTCDDICDRFELVCGEDSDLDDWIEDECKDQCKDDGYEHMCACCIQGASCTTTDMASILDSFCSPSLFGYCGGSNTISVGDCTIEQTAQDGNLLPSGSGLDDLPDLSENVIQEILRSMDTDDREAVDSIMDNYGSSYINDAGTFNDIESMFNEIASALSWGTDTRDELEEALAGVLDSGASSLSDDACEFVCNDFASLCEDTDDSDFDDWLEDECLDHCKDNGKEGTCFCCSNDFECTGEDLEDLVEDKCKKSLVGLCRDDRIVVGNCLSEQKLARTLVNLKMKGQAGWNKIKDVREYVTIAILVGVWLLVIIFTAVICCFMRQERNKDEEEMVDEHTPTTTEI